MKVKQLFVFLLLMPCIVSHAQNTQAEYRPFAQDGKTWEMQVGLIKENIYGNRIDSDTVINGETWKKVFYSYLISVLIVLINPWAIQTQIIFLVTQVNNLIR